jgi:Ni,Fe-hydrogenase III large subunit/Ni,Fe-hydrogenase III component G
MSLETEQAAGISLKNCGGSGTVSYPCAWLISEDETARYYQIPPDYFWDIVISLKNQESVLVCLLAIQDFNVLTQATCEGACSLLYIFEESQSEKFLVFVLSSDYPVSIAEIFPSANLFEREIADGFGIQFAGAYDTRRLFLHECYPEGFYPLKKSFKNSSIHLSKQSTHYEFREINGESVFQVPVGPVHAGIIEPGHFRFSVIGEDIVNLEVRLGYLHRGIEKIAEGKHPVEVMPIAEAISGDESAANACGFSMAVEQICQIHISPRSEYLRGIVLELERAYSLLSDLAGMLTDIAHPVSASSLLVLREKLQRQAYLLVGSRFLKGYICIGGVSQDIQKSVLDIFFKETGKVECELIKIVEWVLSHPSIMDRFASTGIVNPEYIRPLAICGPIARASGYSTDARLNHPYGVYQERPPVQVYEPGGDVLARFTLKYQEILGALRYIQELILFIPGGSTMSPISFQDGYSLCAVESPRGMSLNFVAIKDGAISRYKVRTASFCNWCAIEHAVTGNIVPDFPLINKSMNLSYAGTDL